MSLLTQKSFSKLNYWWFFIPFSMAAILGVAGIVTAELLMPRNPAGLEGLAAIHRDIGTMTLIWGILAFWSWNQICIGSRTSSGRKPTGRI